MSKPTIDESFGDAGRQRLMVELMFATFLSLLVIVFFIPGPREALIRFVSTEFGKNVASGLILILFTVIFVDTRKERREFHKKRAADLNNLVHELIANTQGFMMKKINHLVAIQKAKSENRNLTDDESLPYLLETSHDYINFQACAFRLSDLTNGEANDFVAKNCVRLFLLEDVNEMNQAFIDYGIEFGAYAGIFGDAHEECASMFFPPKNINSAKVMEKLSGRLKDMSDKKESVMSKVMGTSPVANATK